MQVLSRHAWLVVNWDPLGNTLHTNTPTDLDYQSSSPLQAWPYQLVSSYKYVHGRDIAILWQHLLTLYNTSCVCTRKCESVCSNTHSYMLSFAHSSTSISINIIKIFHTYVNNYATCCAFWWWNSVTLFGCLCFVLSPDWYQVDLQLKVNPMIPVRWQSSKLRKILH